MFASSDAEAKNRADLAVTFLVDNLLKEGSITRLCNYLDRHEVEYSIAGEELSYSIRKEVTVSINTANAA